jgi:hypothetical protein
VSERQANLLEEMMSAGRGIIAVLIGDKRAVGYFDFSMHGLIGSFIAVVAVTALAGYLPIFVSKPSDGESLVPVALVILSDAVTLAAQIAAVAILLRQIRRVDLLVPFLVASNWWTFAFTLLLVALLAAGVSVPFSTPMIFYPWLVVNLIIVVNIGRLILQLAAAQVALLVLATASGFLVGSLASLWLILPPELLQKVLADAAAAAG